MLNMRKMNGLVSTFNDSATTEPEQDSAYNLICKAIEKELNCKRWLSANVFQFLAKGEVFFNNVNTHKIGNDNVCDKVLQALTDLGFKYKFETYLVQRDEQKYIVKL